MNTVLTDLVVNDAPSLFGQNDENLSVISDAFGVAASINADGNIRLSCDGYERDAEEKLKNAEAVIRRLVKLSEENETVNKRLTAYLCDLVAENGVQSVNQYTTDGICVTAKGRPIKAKTLGQAEYVESIRKNSVTFGIGPAGTGKTYLAVAMAVSAFRKNEVSRIILTRPAVEAGEKLGFLPGDLKDKLDPYLQPLYDALGDMIPPKRLQDFMEEGIIQIAPLAYMRGRTLDRACVILDEAQNTNVSQLKMFLTRMGVNAKFIVTGDATQVDLPRKEDSGLLKGISLLKNIKGIETIFFSNEDIVRHPLVTKIVKAFDRHESE